MLGDEANDIWASTFHSSCVKILRRNADRLGFTNRFTIYDTDDSRRVMKTVMADLGISEKTVSFPTKPFWAKSVVLRIPLCRPANF